MARVYAENTVNVQGFSAENKSFCTFILAALTTKVALKGLGSIS
tara:strand:+ start:88 stop:219 length:132 start_codon:yes stop_codon:yes gene_type:complete